MGTQSLKLKWAHKVPTSSKTNQVMMTQDQVEWWK